MENGKNSNGGLVVAVVVLTIGIVGLLAFIIFGGSINFDKDKDKSLETNNVNEVQNSNKEENVQKEEKVEKVKGECPLTKFDSSYALTDTDKEELLESIGSYRDSVDTNSFKITSISETGYYIAVAFDINPKTSDTFGFVARVNGKLKFISGIGSGTTELHTKILDDALPKLCS